MQIFKLEKLETSNKMTNYYYYLIIKVVADLFSTSGSKSDTH